tara:strand:- start:385 stop:1569 length:1185 start_codon:yes stop_codon:yes gene_type:complete
MEFNWQLINDSITKEDKKAMTDFINTPNQRFTQGEKVKEFEMEWCKFLGCSHSVYVNSGASANYIMASMMKEMKGIGEVIVSPLGWVSDVSPLVNLGFTPVFVDVDMRNMSITLENIKKAVTDKTVGVTLVHVLGFNAITDEMVHFCRDNDLFLIEDCCEAHGTEHKGDRVGIYGDVSNFSFYFGHHITTIEGGMVCTNDERLYDYAKLFRSHGMTREASSEVQEQYERSRPDLNPLFTFAVPGYNVRNQEINAVLGISQLNGSNRMGSRLIGNIKRRKENLDTWLYWLDSNMFYTDFLVKGNSNFALPLILRKKDLELFKKCCILLEEQEVEFRIGTAGGGNQARQPYLEKYDFVEHNLDNVNHIHEYGLYIGNHPELEDEEIVKLANKLNGV